MSPTPLRLLVVDDSALFRVLLRDALKDVTDVTIVGTAENGVKALERIADLNPDVVTLDLEMPGMDGIQVLHKMNSRKARARVIMVSRHTAVGAQVTTDALMEGAFDFVQKPAGGNVEANKAALRTQLIEKFAAVRESMLADTQGIAIDEAVPLGPGAADEKTRCELVLIGSSTGGPDALRQILPRLPADFRCPVLVVQHMPPKYTLSLANRLNELCPLQVSEATNGESVEPGKILLAPGGIHLGVRNVKGRLVTGLSDAPPEHNCRPAVDYLFRSAFEAVPLQRMLGVILTGMGRDGAEGCALLRDCGGRIIAQHADGCTVYGMPKAVIEGGLADRVVRLERMAAVIRNEC